MKKKLIICGLVVSAKLLFAQPYGQTQYPNGAQLMSGQQTALNSTGFLMGGIYNPGGDHLISITKTDKSGEYNGTPSEFKKHYKFMMPNASCVVGTLPTLNYSGVSVIETNPGVGSRWYALAAAYNNGVIFSTLNSSGTPVSTSFYPFFYSAGWLNKPTIIESSTTPGDFYICGKFDTAMYIIKTNITGTIYWSGYYHAGGGMIEPRDMIISAYNNDLIVVGHVTPDPQYNRASDGFLLDIDPSTGNVVNFVDYSSTPCNWFNSVKNSYCTGNGPGYIVGGYCDPTFNSGGALVMKLDLSGSIIWNTLLTGGSPGVITNEVMDVAERLNSFNNYEYYAATRTINFWPQYDEITVFKLDANGVPMGGINEFLYTSTASSPLTPVKMDYQNANTGADQGLHIYANNNNNFYLLESYFNGYTGCTNESFSNAMTETGPTDIYPALIKYGGFTTCSNQSLVEWAVPYSPNQICSNMSVGSGSNLKTTGITQSSGPKFINAYPNPSNGHYTLETNSKSTVKIVNTLGEVIYTKTLEPGQNNINLESAPVGIYTLWVKDNAGCSSIQLIKE